MAFRVASLAVSAGLALSCTAAFATETEDGECYVRHENAVGFTPARPIDKPILRYPKDAERNLSEGWVLIQHAITSKGEPHRIEVIDAMGAKEFVSTSIDAVKRRRFEPAARNGVAAEQSLYEMSVLYLFHGSGREADHAAFIRKYNIARSHLRAGDADKSIQALEEAFAGRVNLYESAMGSFMFALAYREKSDWERALFHSRHAVIENGRYLEYVTRGPAYALLIELEARTGNYKEAMCELQRLRKIAPDLIATDSRLGKSVASIDAVMKDPKPLGVPGKLAVHPLVETAAVWRHQLLRRKFWFADVKGEVKSFRLACSSAEHEAPFDAEMLWNVPQEAGDCILRVECAPGATFTLVEEW